MDKLHRPILSFQLVAITSDSSQRASNVIYFILGLVANNTGNSQLVEIIVETVEITRAAGHPDGHYP